MAVSVFIAGVDKSAEEMIAGFTVNLHLHGRSTATLRLKYMPEVGQRVLIHSHDGLKLFGGSIDDRNKPKKFVDHYECLCTSFEARLDFRIVRTAVYGGVIAPDDGGSNTWRADGCGLSNDQPIRLTTTGTLPTGFATATTYYVKSISSDSTFQLAATAGGAAIAISNEGSGVHSFQWRSREVIRDLIADWGAGEGITDGTQDVGVFLEKVSFDHSTVSAALDKIAELSGYVWSLTPDLELDFTARTTTAAPFDVDESSNLKRIRNFSYKETREDYRNTQYLRFSFAALDPEVETIAGDGSTLRFWLPKRVASIISATVGGEALSVGVDGVDTDSGFYWSHGERGIRCATAPANGVDLVVTYREFGSDVTFVDNLTEVGERATVEGGSGYYMRLHENRQQTDAGAAVAEAASLLARYGTIAGVAKYETYLDGLRPGMEQSITSASFGLSAASFLITDITAECKTPEIFGYTITAVSGTKVRDFVDVFRELGGGQSSGVPSAAIATGAEAAGLVYP